MGLHQHLQTVSVRGHVSAEAPLLSQDLIEQPVINVRRDTINFIVGSHYAAHMRFLHRSLKGNQKVFADDPLGIIARRRVRSSFRLTVYREMLHGSNDVMASDMERISL